MVAFTFSEQDEAFRAEVRAFLEAQLTDEMRRTVARTVTVFTDRDVALRWQRILHERGWAAPHWPAEFGGPGWSATQRFIFEQECARAQAPGTIPLGLRLLAPVLFRYGTPEQQAHYLPRILSAEHYWCQGYSEPGSGSDLSSLRTRAVADGDDYVVTAARSGRRTRSSPTTSSVWCARGPTASPRPASASCSIDMDRPGIRVEPIITLHGDHEVNQVFFDDVRVPQEQPRGAGARGLDRGQVPARVRARGHRRHAAPDGGARRARGGGPGRDGRR
jgi:alkylation response protein AidB-like acyl-CoA dehydrogenase